MSLDHTGQLDAVSTAQRPADLASWQPGEPLTLRPHNLLCLQGWQGMGYSPAFTSNMNAVSDWLADHPETPVTLASGLDHLCQACPLSDGAACYHDVHDDGWISAHDANTLTRTGLEAGATYDWHSLEVAVAAAITGAEVATFCAQCQWQPMGVCAAGIDQLRARLL